jgi:hypothetical protein
LVARERHQLPLIIAAEQRIVDLVRDVARPAVAVGDGERLHQLPAGKIGDANIAQLAGTYERIERRQHLLDRREGVESVELEQIDVVGA